MNYDSMNQKDDQMSPDYTFDKAKMTSESELFVLYTFKFSLSSSKSSVFLSISLKATYISYRSTSSGGAYSIHSQFLLMYNTERKYFAVTLIDTSFQKS